MLTQSGFNNTSEVLLKQVSRTMNNGNHRVNNQRRSFYHAVEVFHFENPFSKRETLNNAKAVPVRNHGRK